MRDRPFAIGAAISLIFAAVLALVASGDVRIPSAGTSNTDPSTVASPKPKDFPPTGRLEEQFKVFGVADRSDFAGANRSQADPA